MTHLLYQRAENWNMTESDKRKIVILKMDALKSSYRISKLDRVQNDDVPHIIIRLKQNN